MVIIKYNIMRLVTFFEIIIISYIFYWSFQGP